MLICSLSWYELDAIRIWGWKHKIDSPLLEQEGARDIVEEVAVQAVESKIVMIDVGTQVEILQDDKILSREPERSNRCCFQ